MNVDHILGRKGHQVLSISPLASVQDAAQMLRDHGVGALLVSEPNASINAIKGILSERDIVQGVAQRGSECLNAPVSTLMTPDVKYCQRSDTINQVMTEMTQRRIRHLPVMDENRLVGIISIGDVVKFRIEEIETEAEAMREYIAAG